jgi:hypothetical protein
VGHSPFEKQESLISYQATQSGSAPEDTIFFVRVKGVRTAEQELPPEWNNEVVTSCFPDTAIVYVRDSLAVRERLALLNDPLADLTPVPLLVSAEKPTAGAASLDPDTGSIVSDSYEQERVDFLRVPMRVIRNDDVVLAYDADGAVTTGVVAVVAHDNEVQHVTMAHIGYDWTDEGQNGTDTGTASERAGQVGWDGMEGWNEWSLQLLPDFMLV